jgi:COMPASS component SWD1
MDTRIFVKLTKFQFLTASIGTRDIVVNANDRIIRVYNINESTSIPKLQNKFQDLVNRIQWNQVCFSPDGEFIIGGK